MEKLKLYIVKVGSICINILIHFVYLTSSEALLKPILLVINIPAVTIQSSASETLMLLLLKYKEINYISYST